MSEMPIRNSALGSFGSYPVHFMTQQPIDDLCAALKAEFDQDSRGKAVPALLAAYQAEHQGWRDWVFFSEERYTRNLIMRCEAFELLLLGWATDQESPIHDHADQYCWMSVMEGELEETHYTLPEPVSTADTSGVATPAPAILELGRSKTFQAGGVAFIDDSIAYHLIRPMGAAPAVSMHLYANPIDTCRIFCPETGRPEDISLGYHSVRGELSGSATAETIRARFRS